MAGVGFRDIVRTLKVRLFTTKVIKSYVKLQVKSNATKIPRESPYSIIENFAACHNTLRGIKLATSQADRLRSACSLAITLYQTQIVLCPSQVWGARPKKGLSSSKHSSAKLIKAFHKSISKSLFWKRTEAFSRSLSSSELHGTPGFLLRFEVTGTNVSIAGTKDGGRAAILARSAKLG